MAGHLVLRGCSFPGAQCPTPAMHRTEQDRTVQQPSQVLSDKHTCSFTDAAELGT